MVSRGRSSHPIKPRIVLADLPWDPMARCTFPTMWLGGSTEWFILAAPRTRTVRSLRAQARLLRREKSPRRLRIRPRARIRTPLRLKMFQFLRARRAKWSRLGSGFIVAKWGERRAPGATDKAARALPWDPI